MSRRTLGWLMFATLALAFAAVQLSAIDYGTRINDLPHIAGVPVAPDAMTEGSALERETIAGAGGGESLDRWLTRYKLYSVEADEHINVMALARMRPGVGDLDPHFYQYGGAWLYPLGAWYLTLSKAGVVPLAPLPTLLAEPDRMDAVYVWGRVLVLLSVLAAAGLLFDALRRLGGSGDALLATAVFLAAPSTVMFSQVMKPHWYALLWIVLAMHQLVLAFQRRELPPAREGVVAVASGLAVGAVLTNGLFAVGVWLTLLTLVRRGWARPRVLLRVPAAAIAAYLAANPYVLLNTGAFLAEGRIVSDWFSGGVGGVAVWRFVENSILPGFGLAFSATAAAVAAWTIARPPAASVRWLAVYALALAVAVGLMTANIADWHTNTRYVAYLLPAALLLLLLRPWPHRRFVLAAVLGLTVLQGAPLVIAYHDENDPARSTRLRAATWIESNVQAGSGLCIGTETPAPYEVPPVDFRRYRINAEDCGVVVLIDRRMDSPRNAPAGFELAVRFRPVLSPAAFPTVFSHINPQISIYRRRA